MLIPGSRLGPYEIVAPLGAGGMGEVYRAKDSRLGRDVALKVLPGELAGDPDRLRRFEQEARAASALNHPNILVLYDLGTADGTPYLVTELLEGESLRAKLEGGPPPLRRTLDWTRQLAQGLAAAHARGIVHRDLKPENVFVTGDDRIKILDFGLAKLLPASSTSAIAAAPTLAAGTTEPGVVLGTVGYMSPEQVRGLPADHRSDLFALGAILYELLTGRRAFQRESAVETMSAILKEEPLELAESGRTVPPALERIAHHLLEKDPNHRFQSASDLAFDLEALSGTAPSPAISAARSRRLHPAALAALLALALAAPLGLGFLLGSRATSRRPPPSVERVQRLTDFPGLEETPALSPDGRSLAFTADVGGRRQVYVRLIAGGPPLLITSGPTDHQFPRWSPDSSSVVCFAPPSPGDMQGTLWEVSALGGAPRRIGASIGGADVNLGDGRLAHFRLAGERVELVTSSKDGSDAKVVARFDPAYHVYPRWSPDGRRIAFQRGDGVRFALFAVSADGGEPRELTSDRTLMAGIAWLPDSSGIVYSSSRGSTMPYLPTFSLWEVRLAGGPARRVTSGELSYMHPDVHRSGVAVVSRLRLGSDIWKFPAHGRPTDNVHNAVRVTHQTAHVLTPTASPRGDAVAFLSDSGGHANIWVVDAGSGELRQITFERDPEVAVGLPIWSPDGRSIVFVSSRGDSGLEFGLWLVDPDGSNPRRLVARGLGAAWSTDGRSVYYVEQADDLIRKVSIEGGAPVIVRSEPTRNVIGSDGPSLYYVVERQLVDGRADFEILAATPENGPSRLIARIPALRVGSWQVLNPALSPSGAELALPLTDGLTTNIWALSTSTGDWRQVTDFGERTTFIARRVSWSADGQFILAAVGEGDADVVRLDGLIAEHR